MKASHINTPRTMAECQFIAAADPIERPDTPRASLWHAVAWVVLVLAACAAAAAFL